ncbi:MAG: hypothetical protein PVG79_14995 [Gemmatimonadales bacterium]|jgi:hypothetical protein
MRYLAIVLAVAASLVACASGAGSGTETGGARPSRNVLTAEEIAEVRTVHNAYDAVAQLRPQWLTPRPSRSTSDPTPRVPTAFVDRMELSGLQAMRTVSVGEILEIRHFEGGEAVARFGRRYDAGVIQIITR